MIGMTVDNSCFIVAPPTEQTLRTSCDIAQGDSGGPALLRDEDGGLILDEEGRSIGAAITSFGDGGYQSGKTILSEDFLEAVEFIQKIDAQDVVIEAEIEGAPELSFGDDIPSFETGRFDNLGGEFTGYSLGEEVSLEDGGAVSLSGEFTQSAEGFEFPDYMQPNADRPFSITPQEAAPLTP
jgi:hypothetical protein